MADTIEVLEAAHTPGPWDVEDPMGAEIGLSIVQSGLKTYEWSFIAMVCQDDADDKEGRARFISPAEQEANARLIAAAPQLLEALKYARRFLRGIDHDVNYIDGIIAKATGGAA